jgi:hypothetical protein
LAWCVIAHRPDQGRERDRRADRPEAGAVLHPRCHRGLLLLRVPRHFRGPGLSRASRVVRDRYGIMRHPSRSRPGPSTPTGAHWMVGSGKVLATWA